MTIAPKSFLTCAIKGILCGLVYAIGCVLTGLLAGMFHVTLPNLTPAGVSQGQALQHFLFASALMGLCLTPLACGIAGKRIPRWLTLSFLPFICLGLNATIEILIFTTMITRRAAPSLVASIALPAFLFGAALAFVGAPEPNAPSFFQRAREFFATRSLSAWAGRIVLAILAFPVVYFIFGAMVAPLVVPAYRAGIAGLVLPPLSVIMPVQIVRSIFFLLASLPFLILWKGKRGSLILSLGLAHFFLVGLFGLMQASFLPAVLRIAHSLEIAADSFAYAAALTFLLFPRPSASPVPAQAHTASSSTAVL
jgi:hypothetical protein